MPSNGRSNRRTALDNVLAGRLGVVPLWRVATGLFSSPDQNRAIQALDAVGLGDHLNQRVDTLSGGQQQRVAIARALTQGSRLLLADEPVASLDPDTADAVLSLMHSLAKSQRLTILNTLHQPQLAELYADRVIHMRNGRLL